MNLSSRYVFPHILALEINFEQVGVTGFPASELRKPGVGTFGTDTAAQHHWRECRILSWTSIYYFKQISITFGTKDEVSISARGARGLAREAEIHLSSTHTTPTRPQRIKNGLETQAS